MWLRDNAVRWTVCLCNIAKMRSPVAVVLRYNVLQVWTTSWFTDIGCFRFIASAKQVVFSPRCVGLSKHVRVIVKVMPGLERIELDWTGRVQRPATFFQRTLLRLVQIRCVFAADRELVRRKVCCRPLSWWNCWLRPLLPVLLVERVISLFNC